ncbi:MAG TPA: GNAT family N-acetyltransferase [Gaiellaceae bacterium]|jgi:GNAT superfamily N-acetyltransferase
MIIEAQAEYLAYLRRAGETREVDGAFAVKTEASSNTENGVVAYAAVTEVAELVAWLADAPASWLDLEGANHEALIAAGARPENNGRQMSAHISDVRLVPPRNVAVELADVGEWFDFASAHDWFGEPDERVAFERLYRGLVGDRFRLTIARVGGEVVGFASAFYGSDFVLLTQLVVDELARRRGVATALTAERLERARELGCDLAILSPSPEGALAYAAFGFEARPTPPGRWYYLPCSRSL